MRSDFRGDAVCSPVVRFGTLHRAFGQFHYFLVDGIVEIRALRSPSASLTADLTTRSVMYLTLLLEGCLDNVRRNIPNLDLLFRLCWALKPFPNWFTEQ